MRTFWSYFHFAYSLHLGIDRNSLTQKLHIYAADIFYKKDFVINQAVGIIIIIVFFSRIWREIMSRDLASQSTSDSLFMNLE